MKKVKLVVATIIATTVMSMTAFAGEWKQDTTGWWYQNDNGSYPINCWQEINGKQYYFNESGYMLANTITPDGKQVGINGELVEEPLFDIATEKYRKKFTDYQLSTDDHGNAVIVIYFDFTNNSNGIMSASGGSIYTSAYQNGVKLDLGIIRKDNDETHRAHKGQVDYFKLIEPGETRNVADIYILNDNSPVTFKVESFGYAKDATVVFNLE